MTSIRMTLVPLVLLGSVLTSGCWWDRYFYQSVSYIQTWTQEEDDLYGITKSHDPYRGYYGARTSNIEKYGYTSASGTTNSTGFDVRHNLSVPNNWTFVNTDGSCFNQTTYNNRLPHGGTADLVCKIHTGYGNSEYTVIGLEGSTVDGDNNYVPSPDDLGTNFLWPDQQLGQNQALTAGGGNYSLILLTDGNLVQFYNGNDGRWETGTYSGAHLIMQLDGNLVLYNGGWSPVWASNTAGNPGAYLNVQDDGNLVVYSSGDVPLWSLF